MGTMSLIRVGPWHRDLNCRLGRTSPLLPTNSMEFLCQSKFEKRASLWGIAKMHKNGTFCAVQGHGGRLTHDFGWRGGIQFGINTLGLLGGWQLFWDQFFQAVGRWMLI